jgi:hypothetical protein
MRKGSNFALLGAIALVAVFAAACPKRVSIADIQANPSRYQDKTVAVAGVVRDSYGVNIPGTSVRGGIYKVDDGTGTIWILTEDAVPGKGAEIGVEGRVGSGVNWNGRNYGLGMYEKDRKFRRR